jgi:CTP:molybdopterin cytidylyltransferase MocA
MVQEGSVDFGSYLSKWTVKVTSEDGAGTGTGILVTNDGIVATCYHVIGDSNTETIYNNIKIHFHNSSTYSACLLSKDTELNVDNNVRVCDPLNDIALLKINDPGYSFDEVRDAICPLSQSIFTGHDFYTSGFRKAEYFARPLGSLGKIIQVTKMRLSEEIQIPVIQLKCEDIEEGMSGSPVFDVQSQKVIGIISTVYDDELDKVKGLVLAIPVESIVRVYPEIKSKNPGLSKFNNFLQLIGKSESLVYDKFEDVYVTPIEYPEIEETLGGRDRCVFITGTAEYGKTYTSVNLLWQYYKDDDHYIPMYIEEGSKDSPDIIKKLVEQNKILKRRIIYFEDPVGKIEYKSNKEFEDSIDSIIDGLGSLDVYLIVTMREEIYQKFNPTGKIDSKRFVKKLNIGNHSYDYDKRSDMLLKWASVMKCNWLQNETSKNRILEAMEDEAILPTPLNIKDFAKATDESHNEIEEMELLDILRTKSQRTPKSFAKEINEMMKQGEIYKILLLCFPFISGTLSFDCVEDEYNKLLRFFDIKDSYAFERAFTKLQDKIEFSRAYVRFSHPSYSEALPFLLLEDGVPTEINLEFFSNVLLKLADNPDAARDVADTVARNFDKLPENVRNGLLMKLADNPDAARYVADTVARNFDKLPENTQKLLFELADNPDAARYVADTVADNFDKLPENVRNGLLMKLADNPDAARDVADTVARNFDKLPENTQKLLFELADNPDAARYVADTVARNFDKLPENTQKLLFELADNKDAARDVADTVADNFDKLPENVRNGLLMKLADNPDAAWNVGYAVAHNFDKLPENVRNELQRRLGEHGKPDLHIHGY